MLEVINAECHFCCVINKFFMVSVIMLNVVMLSVIMPSVVVLTKCIKSNEISLLIIGVNVIILFPL